MLILQMLQFWLSFGADTSLAPHAMPCHVFRKDSILPLLVGIPSVPCGCDSIQREGPPALNPDDGRQPVGVCIRLAPRFCWPGKRSH
jgi:hypothetical protein